MATKTSFKKRICVLSICVTITLFETNSLELYSSSERETKFCRRLFTSSIKREIRHFQVMVEQWLQRNGRKSMMHVQNCCFASSTNCFFDILVAVTVMASYCFYKVQLGTMLESFFHCLSLLLNNSFWVELPDATLTKISSGQNTLHGMICCVSCRCGSIFIACRTEIIVIAYQTFKSFTTEICFTTWVTANTCMLNENKKKMLNANGN